MLGHMLLLQLMRDLLALLLPLRIYVDVYSLTTIGTGPMLHAGLQVRGCNSRVLDPGKRDQTLDAHQSPPSPPPRRHLPTQCHHSCVTPSPLVFFGSSHADNALQQGGAIDLAIGFNEEGAASSAIKAQHSVSHPGIPLGRPVHRRLDPPPCRLRTPLAPTPRSPLRYRPCHFDARSREAVRLLDGLLAALASRLAYAHAFLALLATTTPRHLHTQLVTPVERAFAAPLEGLPGSCLVHVLSATCPAVIPIAPTNQRTYPLHNHVQSFYCRLYSGKSLNNSEREREDCGKTPRGIEFLSMLQVNGNRADLETSVLELLHNTFCALPKSRERRNQNVKSLMGGPDSPVFLPATTLSMAPLRGGIIQCPNNTFLWVPEGEDPNETYNRWNSARGRPGENRSVHSENSLFQPNATEVVNPQIADQDEAGPYLDAGPSDIAKPNAMQENQQNAHQDEAGSNTEVEAIPPASSSHSPHSTRTFWLCSRMCRISQIAFARGDTPFRGNLHAAHLHQKEDGSAPQCPEPDCSDWFTAEHLCSGTHNRQTTHRFKIDDKNWGTASATRHKDLLFHCNEVNCDQMFRTESEAQDHFWLLPMQGHGVKFVRPGPSVRL
ncbi:hypothetical protein K438DRAFT_2101892 [Mycena galopus ATCC 62051]|nr:hypothetical protein K438DRAFT_2101892 [Mycena galopus ATCC 62051]